MSRIRRLTPRARGWSLASVPVAITLLAVLGAGPVVRAATADHLIISEVVTKTREVSGLRIGSEYIEIVNPTGSDIDLGSIYLTDATFATNSTFYFRITDGTPTTAKAGGGEFNDFHVKFPAGAVLAAGDTLAISVNGSTQYFEAYGRLPDFELYEDATTPDTVPEMEAVFPGSVHGGNPLGEQNTQVLPNLSDTAESLVLYTWDGASDLVQDVDYMYWGTSASVQIDKTGITIGAGTYLPDTAPASQQPVSASAQNFGQSYARLSADEGAETATGGNGLTGHDETSEDLGTTWQIAATQDPPAAPATFFAAAPIFRSGGNAPAAPYEGLTAELSVVVLSNSALSGVDFHYTLDGGAVQTLAGADAGSNTWSATLPSQTAGTVVVWWAEASNAAGATATWPVAAPTFSEGWTTGEAPDPTAGPAKLLITELATVGTAQEFVEIANLNATPVDMSDYYLTDAIFATGSQYYWRIAEGNPSQTTIGGGAFADFHAKFPAGFTIAAGDTIVVSIAGSTAFAGEFGFTPDLELYEEDAFPDAIPDMEWVFGDEVNNSIINRTGASPSTPTLTNGAETVILYHWDGTSDFVTDIDMFTWKDPSSTTTSMFFNKTGQTIGTHTYLPEVGTSLSNAFPTQAEFGFSYHRIDASEGNQVAAGSNGVGGRDETSEDLANTFELREYDPSRPSIGGGGGGGSTVGLSVEAKTFLPSMGEVFPIEFVSKPQSETRLRIFDQQGRIVITLFDSRFHGAPSVNPDQPSIARWDGLDEFLQPVKAGMYIAHLSVTDNATGEQENKIAPVVIATRLSK